MIIFVLVEECTKDIFGTLLHIIKKMDRLDELELDA